MPPPGSSYDDAERVNKERRRRAQGKEVKRLSSSKALKKFRKKYKRSSDFMRAVTTLWVKILIPLAILAMLVVKKTLDWFFKTKRFPSDPMRAMKERHQSEGKLMLKTAAIFMVDLNPFWAIHIQSDIPVDEFPPGAIYMFNHVSFSDAIIVNYAQAKLGLSAISIGKADVAAAPVMRDILLGIGFLPVEFYRDEDGSWKTRNRKQLMENAKKALEAGLSINVAPEGTISKIGHLKTFRMGFFKVAVEADAPIIPISMWNNDICWPNDPNATISQGTDYMQPADIYVRFGAPIKPNLLTPEEFRDKVFNRIQEMRNELPDFDLPDELANLEPTKIPEISLLEQSDDEQ